MSLKVADNPFLFSVNWDSQGLDDLPLGFLENSDIQAGVKEISLKNNSLSSLPFSLFSKFERLVKIDATNNVINGLEGLWDFAKDTSSRGELLSLCVAENQIQLDHSTEGEIKRSSEFISELDLRKNEIRNISTDFAYDFRHFKGLGEKPGLGISGNPIYSVTWENSVCRKVTGDNGTFPEWFGELDEMKTFKGQNCQVKEISSKMVNRWKNIQVINLEGNLIRELSHDIFFQSKDLENLTLTKNMITFLPPKLFTSNLKLRNLELNRNELTKLEADLFDTNNMLQALDVSENALTSSRQVFGVTKKIRKLEKLSLAGNELKGSLDRAFFANNPELSQLWLENNQLSGSLDPALFANNPELSELWLDANQFEGCVPMHCGGWSVCFGVSPKSEQCSLKYLPGNNGLTGFCDIEEGSCP